jgi:Cytochrome P460
MSCKFAAAAAAAVLATVAVAFPACAGGDKVAFPAAFAEGVLYATIDRADNKQFRELFTSQAAIEAAGKGEPLPAGTVITLLQYRAQLDDKGNPLKDEKGRFMRGDLIGFTVMEKRSGWGAEYPPEVRNGEWEYQAFTTDHTANEKANLTACFNCHKPLDKQDFVFSYDRMKAAAK